MASSHYFDDGQGATRDKRADCDGLFVEPYIFPARSVEDAVDHHDLAHNPKPIDTHYQAIRVAMKGVFHELGLAA